MEARQLRKRGERGLEPHVLRGAELALKHKLRRKFSADFTARHADDLIAKAAKEYAVAVARGERIENPGGFLVDVAYKRAIDALRKEGNDPELDELEAASSLPDPSVADPSEELEHEEARSQIYEAISHLEGEERQVIALVYFEGMSGRESAGPLGVSETTALRRLRSASAKLREWLPAIEKGSFCAEAAPQLRALAAGTAEGLEVTQAKLHLENCASLSRDDVPPRGLRLRGRPGRLAQPGERDLHPGAARRSAGRARRGGSSRPRRGARPRPRGGDAADGLWRGRGGGRRRRRGTRQGRGRSLRHGGCHLRGDRGDWPRNRGSCAERRPQGRGAEGAQRQGEQGAGPSARVTGGTHTDRRLAPG